MHIEISILNNLKNKAVLIAPSRRLAATLRVSANQLFKESLCFETPLIFALDDWLKALWDQLEIHGKTDNLLLNSTQSLLLFEKLIEQSEQGQTLLKVHQTAKLALQAWDLLNHWQCEHALTEAGQNIDEAAFKVWAIGYQDWLSRNACIDTSMLPKQILSLIEKDAKPISHVIPNKTLILYGFEELSPLLTHFFNALKLSGWEVSQVSLKQQPAKIMQRVAFENKTQEYLFCAKWAKALQEKNQTATIIVPNLADERSTLDSIFRDTFEPNHVVNPTLTVCPFFNISAATPFIQYPLVSETLNCLKMALQSVNAQEVVMFIKSVFIAGGFEEATQRASLAAVLPYFQHDKYTLKKLIPEIKKANDTPLLLDKLSALLPLLQGQPKTQPMSLWVEVFRSCLSLLGWPGERPLTSVEYQLVKRMDELFNELAPLESVLGELAAFEAINLLQKVAANTPFQAENKGAPIQLLGLLEGAGQQVENLWIMGMDSETWPQVATPNPFIAIAMQRALKMPHANAERELAYARNLTNHFKQCANHITFSYSLNEKERKLQASELIADIPLISHNSLDAIPEVRATTSLEAFEDNYGPALLPNEAFQGKANTLQRQALCPFSAFAVERLGLKESPQKSIWLSASEQGNLLHAILEDFWSTVKSKEMLCSFDQSALSQQIQTLVAKHLAKVISAQAPSNYQVAEKNRLVGILLDYIQLEKERTPFKVLALEEKRSFTLANIRFSLRLDRLDEDASGNTIIIDYKTGKFDLAALFDDRLVGAQLALYFCASVQQNPKAIVAMKLNSKSCEFEGISEFPLSIPGVVDFASVQNELMPSNWQSLPVYWHDKLTVLANEFQQGYAKVSPLYGQNTCHFCHLSALCRKDELGLNNV